MSSDMIRIRITRLPSARDLEYFALRYLKVDGIYEVPLELANDLIEFECATPSDGPLTDNLDSVRTSTEDDAE